MSTQGLKLDQNIYEQMLYDGIGVGYGVGGPVTILVVGLMLGVGHYDIESLYALTCVPGCAIIGAVNPLIIGAVRKHLDENRGKALEQNLEEL